MIYQSFTIPLSKTFTQIEVHSHLPSLRIFPKQKVHIGAYMQSTSHLTSPKS